MTLSLPPLYASLPVTEKEKEILYMRQITGVHGSYGRYVGSLKVEFIHVEGKGWKYRIHTLKKTGYETSSGIIESSKYMSSDGQALNRAENMCDLYHMACVEYD